MYTSFLRRKNTGFTIVELVVVIVVIGILASIVAVGYTGVHKNAVDKGVLSDLEGVSGEVVHYSTMNNGAYGSAVQWYSPNGANANIGFVPTSGNIVDVNANASDYCVRVYNPNSSNATLSTAVKKESNPGVCGAIGPSTAAIAANPQVNGGVVTTLAGTGSTGTVDGVGTAASFNYPYGITMDGTGNVYVGDTVNNRIRKITTSGTVTTYAGTGLSAWADGTAATAAFYYPYGVYADSTGTVSVADSSNNRIRQISTSGNVTTLAGSASLGVSCPTSPALLRNPTDVVADNAGNYYVADFNSNCIRKITSAGVVTTLAGTGVAGNFDAAGASATFRTPFGIDIDSSGNIYIADSGNNEIRKIASNGSVSTIAGSSTGASGYINGATAAARFNNPYDVAVDRSGNIYVADRGNNAIRKIGTDGIVSTLAGSTTGVSGSTNGTTTAARFNSPSGIDVDGSGVVYVADTNNHLIRVIR